MTTCFLAPDPVQGTFFIPGGNTPGNGAQVFFYVAGSVSTKQTVYKDNAAAVAWTNPIVLDSGGNLPSGGEVWFPTGQTFKVVWAPSNDTDPPTSPYRTMDNLSGMNDSSGTASEWIGGATPTFISSTQFTLAGDQTATYTPGRRLKSTNTGGTIYSTVVSSVFGALTTITVQNDSGVLDAGLSTLFYGLLAADHLSVPQSTLNAQPQVNARLTVVSGIPVPTDDVSTTKIYLTPYKGNTIDFYNLSNTNWERLTFSEVSTSIPTTTIVHDVFAFASSGAVIIETVAWATNTSRSASLSVVSGMLVKTSDNHLYVGSIFPASSGVISDTASTRTVFNYWNQVDRPMACYGTTASWTYPQASNSLFTVVGGSSNFAMKAVYGQSTAANVWHLAVGRFATVTTSGQIVAAVGVDSFNNATTGTLNGRAFADGTTAFCQAIAFYKGIPGIGLHTYAPVVQFQGTTSFIWLGTNNVGDFPGLAGTYKG